MHHHDPPPQALSQPQPQQHPQPQTQTPPPPPPSLSTIPSEILLTILQNLDIPDLHALTRTSQRLRATATDPLLHRQRRQAARAALSQLLPARPSAPPQPPFLTPQQATQRALSKSLTKISLKRKLSARPSLPALIERGVIPRGVFSVAPALVGRAQELEKERVKDRLRRGLPVDSHSIEEVAERDGWECIRPGEGRLKVRELARRYDDAGGSRKRRRETPQWGSGRRVRWDPPRANVLALKRFYEMLTTGVSGP